ncbi:serine/threonine-protein kinase [Labilithrix luteola]|nr:serine/threonine-protein kinase [Labilithrix luteola]
MPARGPELHPGDVLPGTKYRVVQQLGVGGMGVVYRVVKPPEIHCVLKLMSTDLSSHPEFRERFFDEVRVLAQLDHPNIVRVFDYDTLQDGTPFYVMELLHGQTVRDVLGALGRVPPRVAFEIARQLLEALHCAHTNPIQVVHRDIKPENIFLHAPRHGEPVVKLIDFGVVALSDRQHDGTFVGTWSYAAPEQIRGLRATPATDLYAVGLVLYEMLCGCGPFDHHDTGTRIAQAHMTETPAPVSKFAPWVPPSVVELIASALAKDPRQRPRDAYAFAERLYELEWANDGKDPNDRTSEGPLARVLSTVGGVARASNREPPKVPVVGVPGEARFHGENTLRGVGQDGTSPGEDALLDGLVARNETGLADKPRRSAPKPNVPLATPRPPLSNAATLDAPKTDVGLGAPASALAAKHVDTDTFASQASDTARRGRNSERNPALVPLVVTAAVVFLGTSGVVVHRWRAAHAPPVESALIAPPPMTAPAPPPTNVLVAEPATSAPSAPASAPTVSAAPVESTTRVAPKAANGGARSQGTSSGAAGAKPVATNSTVTTTPSPASPPTPSANSAPSPAPSPGEKPGNSDFIRKF